MMPRLEIGDSFAIDVASGASLLEICEEHDAPIPFDCRGGACGTCLVEVICGGENLSPLTDNEEIMLEDLPTSTHERRLACQVRVLGSVRLRAVVGD